MGWGAAFGLVVWLGACSGGEDSSGDCHREPPVTWESWGHGFLDQQCTACHSSLVPEGQRNGAPPTVNFDTYADVLGLYDRIAARVAEGSMPPGGGASAAQQALMAEWARCQLADDARVATE